MSHKMHVNVWVKVILSKELLNQCPINRDGKDACECTWFDDLESQVKHIFEEMDFGFSDTTGSATIEDSSAIDMEVKYKEKVAEFKFDLVINMDEGEELSNVVQEMDWYINFNDKELPAEIVDHEVVDSK